MSLSLQHQLLASGDTMPSIGLGLWKIDSDTVANTIVEAVRAGYRHLDGACDYGNEVAVGEGIRRAIDEGLCTRDELWVTSKLWNTYHRKEHVPQALERSLSDLGLDYLDLYLVHFPVALAFVPFETRYPPAWIHDPAADKPVMKPEAVPLRETWQAMEAVLESGRVRNIGVSNYNIVLLRELMKEARHAPQVLQAECHPYLTQPKLLQFCRDNQIAMTAYSPLAALSYVELDMADASETVLDQTIVKDIAARIDRTPAQVVLRWGLQRGTSIIPKTSRPERLPENAALFDFELTDADMQGIASLDRNQRFNDPGVYCEKAFNTPFPIFE